MDILAVLRMKYPGAFYYSPFDKESDVELFDDNGKTGIRKWNDAKLGKQPTIAELEKWSEDHAAEIDAAEKTATRQSRYASEADPLKPEAEAEIKQGRPQKYFEYMRKRLLIRRETEPEETKLALVKKDQLAYWKVVCDNMLTVHYTSENRDGYTVQLIMAGAAGLTNRQNYLAQLFVWGSQLNTMFYTARDAIEAAETVEDVLAVNIDFTAWEAADPQVTFSGAMAIEN